MPTEQTTGYAMETLAHGTRVCVAAPHKFGADALLLAHFAKVRRAERVCDLGTGCGIIPLWLHDRGHRGPCAAVDVSGEGVALLQASLALLVPDEARHIWPACADLRVWQPEISKPSAQPFDVVICNPPYHTGGRLSPQPQRAAARHEQAHSCTVAQVCTAASRLLRSGGALCLCQRPARLTDVLCAMRAAHIEPKRLQFVAAQPGKEPWLVLVEGQKNRAAGVRVLPQLFTENMDGTRPSCAMREIYEG